MDNKPQPEKQDKEILKAILTPEGRIKVIVSSNHTPSLSYIHKLLGVEIDKRIINEQIGLAQKDEPVIKTFKQHNIIDFLRGQRN